MGREGSVRFRCDATTYAGKKYHPIEGEIVGEASRAWHARGLRHQPPLEYTVQRCRARQMTVTMISFESRP